MAGLGIVTEAAGIFIRPPPEGVGGNVACGQLPANLPQHAFNVLLQPAKALRADQRIPGQGTVPFQLQGQEAVVLPFHVLHRAENLRVIQNQALANKLFVHCAPVGILAHIPSAPDNDIPGGEVQHACPLYRQSVEGLPLVFQGKQV